METIFTLVLGWCQPLITCEEDIELVVEEQLREYDHYCSKLGMTTLSDNEWENLEYSLGEYLRETTGLEL